MLILYKMIRGEEDRGVAVCLNIHKMHMLQLYTFVYTCMLSEI